MPINISHEALLNSECTVGGAYCQGICWSWAAVGLSLVGCIVEKLQISMIGGQSKGNSLQHTETTLEQCLIQVYICIEGSEGECYGIHHSHTILVHVQ